MAALLRYAYFVLFMGSIVEGDATLVTAGFLARRGYLRIWAVVLVAAVATTVANEFYYRVARTHAEGVFRRKAEFDPRLARVRVWAQSRGSVLLLFSRFMWGFRIAIPLACGAVSMPRLKFSFTNVAGAFLWAIPMGLLGYFFGQGLEVWVTHMRRYEWEIAGSLVVGVFIVLLKWRRKDFRQEIVTLVHPADAIVNSAQDLSVKLKSDHELARLSKHK